MADHLSGHTLANFAFRKWHQWQRPVGVRLDIDEAWRDDQPSRVNYAPVARAEIRRYRNDVPVAYRDISFPALGAGAIDD